ncbi:MAG: methionyl-tRNA formyltransferase [Syntrophothermus sp.]
MQDNNGIIFYGTPEFAVASLDAILKAGFTVKAVVTAPDRPAGRGLKLLQPEVKKYAVEHDIKVLQPVSLKDPGFLEELHQINPVLQVIVAFRKLPAGVFTLPPLGTFNLHASLLPKYRGAAPINHAIMNGETESGVTTFFLSEEIDTGNILFAEKVSIRPDETAGELHDELMVTGAILVVKTIQAIFGGTAVPVPQPAVTDPSDASYKAPKIHKEDCMIDLTRKVEKVYNHIRGLSPYPGAFLTFTGTDGNDHLLKVYECSGEIATHTKTVGSFITDGKSYLKIALADGYVNLTKIQLSGRKAMGIAEFLRGFAKLIPQTM